MKSGHYNGYQWNPEDLHSEHIENLEGMEFLEAYDLPKLNQDSKNNFLKSVLSDENRTAVMSHPTKSKTERNHCQVLADL